MWKRIALIFVIVLLGAGLVSYLSRARAAVVSPLELDYGEGTVLWQTENLPHLSTAVHPLGTYPYILFNYTPVYHAATWMAAHYMPGSLAAGRVVSVLSMLGICVIVASIVWWATRTWTGLLCGIVGGLFILHLPNADWSLLMRVDTIGIFFTYLGLAIFLASNKRPWLNYVAFAFFLLAIYSKQTLIAAPAACLVCLFIQNRRLLLQVLALCAGAGLAILAVLGAITHGEIVHHFFKYNVSPFHWKRGIYLALLLVRQSAPIVILGLIFAAKVTYKRFGSASPRQYLNMARNALTSDGRSRAGLVFVLYLVIASVTSVSIAKVGANVNYLLEWLFACCLLAALCLEDLLSLSRGKAAPLQALGLAVAASIAFITAPLHVQAAPAGSADMNFAHQALIERLRAMPGDVYSEEMTVLLQAGKAVPAEPASVTFLSAMHLWDERQLVDRFRDQYFSAVVVNTTLDNPEHFSPAVRAAIDEEYEFHDKAGPYLIYFPRSIHGTPGRKK